MKMAASKCSKQNGALNLQKLSPAVYLLLLLALHFPQTTSPDRTIMFPVPLIIICLELITLLLLISSLLPSPFSLLLPKLANMLPWCSKPFWACFTHVYIKIFYIKLSTDLLAKFHNIFFFCFIYHVSLTLLNTPFLWQTSSPRYCFFSLFDTFFHSPSSVAVLLLTLFSSQTETFILSSSLWPSMSSIFFTRMIHKNISSMIPSIQVRVAYLCF